MKLRESVNRKKTEVVRKVVESSPRTLQVFYAFVQRVSLKTDDGPKSFTPEEALPYKIQCKLSKDQYTYTRQSLIDRNHNAFPAYDQLSAYKKASTTQL